MKKNRNYFSPLLFISLFFIGACINRNTLKSNDIKIKSAKLHFELKKSQNNETGISVNGKKVGTIPSICNGKFNQESIEIPNECLSSLATVNIIDIGDISKNYQKAKTRNLFTIRNIFLEIKDTNGNSIISNIQKGPFNAFKTGFTYNKKREKIYTYLGCPIRGIRLLLPTEELGHIKQHELITPDKRYSPNPPRKWKDLDKIPSQKKRTSCWIRPHEFIIFPNEYIVDILKRHNSNTFAVYGIDILERHKKKIKELRSQGIKILLTVVKFKGYPKLPGSKEHSQFLNKLKEWAPLVDIINMDEWFLSPPVLKTEGGHATPITEEFLKEFAKYSGYSMEDAHWAFKNHQSDDKRALKAWEFCDKVQNNMAKDLIKVVKKANPNIITLVSYVGRNWNKSVTSIDSAIGAFDGILQCQTYWYGRSSEDSLESSLITAPLGMGKIFKYEYPEKTLWVGIDPGYTGGISKNSNKTSWQNKLYGNKPEEIVPYLALLYAISEEVFVQSAGGGIWLQKKTPVIDGNYADRFADMIMLVSNIVPYIDAYRKSNIAYYYDPDADWETIRRVNRFVASRETNETAIGFLEQFCDVDVTKDIQKYENVIYSGLLLPKKLNYAKQNIYLMYAPEYDEKGNKATEDELYAKLNLRGFSNLGKNFFPAGKYHENGCKDKLHSPTLEKNFFASGKTIKGAEYPLRKAFFPTLSNKEYVIGARNKKGNILINSIWTSFVNQAIGKAIIEQDLDYFGWTKRNCPQVNGKDKIVAVAFRESRTAVIDFGQNTQISKINIIIFNGYNGIIRNETITYNKGMKITLAPFNVLVAYGKN